MGKHSIARFMDECCDDHMMSHDIHLLQKMYERVPVFIYGTEKFKFSEHRTLLNFPRAGIGFTVAPTFLMYKNKYNDPIVLNKPLMAAKGAAKVQGEIYIVPIDTIIRLDASYERGNAFIRMPREIMFYPPEEKDKKDKRWVMAKAFMYHGIASFWDDKVQDGSLSLIPRIEPDKEGARPYYTFRWEDDKPNRDRKAY